MTFCTRCGHELADAARFCTSCGAPQPDAPPTADSGAATTVAVAPVEGHSADPVAGWYPDPSGSGQLRYWDGTAWTSHIRDTGQPSAHEPGDAAEPHDAGGPDRDASDAEGVAPAPEAKRRSRRAKQSAGAGVGGAAALGLIVAILQWQSHDNQRTPSYIKQYDQFAIKNGVACFYSPTFSTPTGGSTHSTWIGLPSFSSGPLDARYSMRIATNRGAITAQLDTYRAPCTVHSIRFLADHHFYDNTTCHRLTTNAVFILQCGDPTGTGTGGPEYSFADENLKGATYPAGTVAMANSGPNTNGSQFFLVYRDSPLPPNYTPFGKITSGLPVLQAIADQGTDNTYGPGDGHPNESVIIQQLTISSG